MRDAVPGPFTGAVLVAEEMRLDAGFDAVQAMRDSSDNRIDQLNESSPGGAHDVAFGRSQHGLIG